MLIESLRIDDDDSMLREILITQYPEIWKNLVDVLGTNLMNISGKSLKQPIKSMFKSKSKKEENLVSSVRFVDPKTGKVMTGRAY